MLYLCYYVHMNFQNTPQGLFSCGLYFMISVISTTGHHYPRHYVHVLLMHPSSQLLYIGHQQAYIYICSLFPVMY